MSLEVRLSFELPGFRASAEFEVRPGERLGITGPSGCGKTTLLRIIGGLHPWRPAARVSPEAEGIRLSGRALEDLPPEARGIGFVFQEPALLPGMTVLENVTYGLKIRGVGRAERETEGTRWLERVGLADRARGSVLHLSGGERQRVAWARALIWKPGLILLDEPFSALDAGLRADLRRELVSLHREHPVPLILVSHDPQDLEAVATFQIRCEENPERGERRFARADSFKD